MSGSIYKSIPIKSSEITPRDLFLNRRQFLKSIGIVGASALWLTACAANPGLEEGTNQPIKTDANQKSDELGDPANSFDQIAGYNNYYEFTTNKEGVARLAENFPTSPWQVEVSGLVNKPKTYSLEDLLKFAQEERIYRLRCVEGWSMVIPWNGFRLSDLLKQVEPLSGAKYVKFTTILNPEEMPGQRNQSYPWPYTEGLRLDEAMHDLTILATGLYGELMPAQNGAPVRLVVPWKYGFKSIKAIVKIELVDQQPETMWSTIAPNEYGFYSNVNPLVAHPRWSQSSERRIGESGRRETLMFNGYAEEVAQLYTGMDLGVYY